MKNRDFLLIFTCYTKDFPCFFGSMPVLLKIGLFYENVFKAFYKKLSKNLYKSYVKTLEANSGVFLVKRIFAI
ncbi:MAG: hypothetical protein U0N86_05535, partial [Lachnospiraceae bacterium]